jgi:TolB-like protein/Tfp pilus assembly protein PilF
VTVTPATQARVFLSFSGEDFATAQRLCAALEAAGQPCWIAPRDVRPDEAEPAATLRAINDCRLLLLLLSAHSAASPQVLREVGQANSAKRPLLAIRLDATALPPGFKSLPGANRWLDASRGTIDDVLPALIGSLRAPARSPAQGPRWLPLLLGIVALLILYLLADRFWLSRIGAAREAATVSVPPADIPDLPVVATVAENSVAVLPFADLSERKDQEYFADGMAADLIDQLTGVSGLQVPARTSSFHFRGQNATNAEIAQALGVTYVLTGTVRRAGTAVRVHAALIRAGSGVTVWSGTYNRDLKDVFKVQDDIAGGVVAALQLALPATGGLVAARPANIEAYNQTLLGRHLLDQFTEANGRRAIEAFTKAVALDPRYVSAWVGLSVAEARVGTLVGDQGGVTRGLAAADQAIALAPDSAGGYGVRGWIRSLYLWDWEGAAHDFDRAQTLDPDNVFSDTRANLAATLGHADEAIRLLELAVQRDPLSAVDWNQMATLLLESGRIREGRAAAHRALDIDPDFPTARLNLAVAALLEGHADEALPEAQAVSDEQWRLPGLAIVQHSLGNEPESRRALDALINSYAASAAYRVAEAYAWRGDRTEAFAWLDRAWQQRDGGLAAIKLDRFMDSLRQDRRYAALLRRLRLPP